MKVVFDDLFCFYHLDTDLFLHVSDIFVLFVGFNLHFTLIQVHFLH